MAEYLNIECCFENTGVKCTNRIKKCLRECEIRMTNVNNKCHIDPG